MFLVSLANATLVEIKMEQNNNYVDGSLDLSNPPVFDYTPTPNLLVGDDGLGVQRGFLDFNTSVIPDNAVINNVIIQLAYDSNAGGVVNIDAFSLNQTAKSFIDGDNTAKNVLKLLCTGALVGANVTIINNNSFNPAPSAGDVKNLTLNTNATLDLQQHLSSDFFTLCLRATTESGGSGNGIYIRTNESTTVASRPMIFVDYTADVTPPGVTIVRPQNVTYNNAAFPLGFNVTLNENGSVMYTLNGGATNISMTGNESLFYGTGFNATNASIPDGTYTFRVYANDTAGNSNYTESLVFSVDRTPPAVTIVSPSSGQYGVSTLSVNISLNEAGSCVYSLDGASNTSLTNTGNLSFTGTLSSLSNADHTLFAYCNDTVGNTNYTVNSSFTVSVTSNPTGGGPGGGGPACTVANWTYTAWSNCVNGTQTRTGTSNCNTHTNQSQSCGACVNQCSVAGTSCSGNFVQTCALVNGCYTLSSLSCGNLTCSNGQCISQTGSGTGGKYTGTNSYTFGGNVSRPSDLIPHGDVPPLVVDIAAPIVGIGIIGGIVWWIWIAIASSLVPLFLLKLRHYSASIFDTNNSLKIFAHGKIREERLAEFLEYFEARFGKLVFAERTQEVVKYLSARGFVEVRLDEPFIMMGHFSKSKDLSEFRLSLASTLKHFGVSGKVNILESVEKASIIGAFRAYRRTKKSEKEIGRLFK